MHLLRSRETDVATNGTAVIPKACVDDTSVKVPYRVLDIAMIGTRGVPARYGGFETAVEEIGARLVDQGHRVSVYCRATDEAVRSHRGMRLVHLPAIRQKALETLAHTALSELHMQRRLPDVVLMFNAANATLLPLLKVRRTPVAVHVDGIEWQRAKWGRVGRIYYRTAEKLAVKWADALIADSAGIAEYYRSVHHVDTVLISYGAPIIQPSSDAVAEMGLRRHQYHLVVARFEPENNVHLIVSGYRKSRARRPLVVVGSAAYDRQYLGQLRRAAADDPRIRFVGSIWDQTLLDQLYGNAISYVHGHSVGGTNPSLLRAMGAGAPVIAFDVRFNREVLDASGVFFSTSDQLSDAIEQCEQASEDALVRGNAGQLRASQLYRWDDVAARYERLCLSLANQD